MKRLPPLPVKGRRFTAASRAAAAAARASAAEAARAAAQPVEEALEADEHAFLVSKLRERLASLHAAGEPAVAAAKTGRERIGDGEGRAAEEKKGALTAAEADAFAAAAEDLRLLEESQDAMRSSLKIVNDIESLRRKLAEIAYQPPRGMRRTPWIETLAVVAPAAVAAVDGCCNGEGGEAGVEATKKISGPVDVHSDIEREAYFMRLTAAAATEGLRRLRQLRVKFTRPADFYAEMLKSDAHMERVRARVADEQQQQQEFLEKKNRERNKKFHKQSGNKLLRMQEEARARNLELKQLEAWKQQRRQGGGAGASSSSSSSGAATTAAAAQNMRKKQQGAPTAGLPGSGGKPMMTAVEAAFDQWLADRETQKNDKNPHHQARQARQETRRPSGPRHHTQSKKQHAGRHPRHNIQKKHHRRK